MGLTRQPDGDVIVAIVESQLRLRLDLAPVFATVDGAEEGSEERAGDLQQRWLSRYVEQGQMRNTRFPLEALIGCWREDLGQWQK